MHYQTQESYGRTAKLFHWLMALIFLIIFPLGYIMTSLNDSDFKFSVYDIHKSIGLVLFILVSLRLGFRLAITQPQIPHTVPIWQKNIAKLNIALLYFLMFAMPVTGFMSSILGGYDFNFFSLFIIKPIYNDKLIAGYFEQIHGILSYLLIAAFSLHLLGALYHHYFLRDNVLKRMLPNQFMRK